MSTSGLMLLGLLCVVVVFHPGNCDLASYLKKHASSLLRSQSLTFVNGMEILGKRGAQSPVQAEMFGKGSEQRPVQAEMFGKSSIQSPFLAELLGKGSYQRPVQARIDNESPWFCHGLDCPKYKSMSNESGYEVREYDASHWFSTSLAGVSLDEAERDMFFKLFEYIEGKNADKLKIKMTAPVLIRLIPGEGPTCKSNFTMSFFDAPKVPNPPAPTDKDVFFSSLPQQKVYVASFPGFANKQKWIEYAEKLATALEKDGRKFDNEYYFTAGYDSPYKIVNRHNEVWYIALD